MTRSIPWAGHSSKKRTPLFLLHREICILIIPSYVTADYERHNFSVSQCTWDAVAKEDIIPIYPPSPTNGTGSPSDITSSSAFPLSAGIIAGIAIGIAAILVLLAILILILIRKRRRAQNANRLAAAAEANGFLKPELDAQEPPLKIAVQELDGQGTKVCSEVEGRMIYEAEGEGRMAVEIGGGEWCVYEMPAKEEVAAEIGETDIYDIGDRPGDVVGESGGVVSKRDIAQERDDTSSIQEERHFSVGRAHS
jgi:hypothetical protein